MTRDEVKLLELYRLARVALAGTGNEDVRHSRMVWAAEQFAIEDGHMKAIGAYKMLDRALAPQYI